MKRYHFSDKSDYIFYLSEIIIDEIKYKKVLSDYRDEMNSLLQKNKDALIVETFLYESLSNKTKSVLSYLFNLIGDDTKSAISYKKFRKLLCKNKKILTLNLKKMSKEEENILNDFNIHRNWGLHIPESLFTSKRNFLKIDRNYINKNKDEIIVPTYKYYDIEFLKRLHEEVCSVIEVLDKLEFIMIDDYKNLAGCDPKLTIEVQNVKPYKIMDIVKASMDTQRKNSAVGQIDKISE